MLDDRAKLLMKALVERYIADGQPVGSRTLSRQSGLELSPATIRNVMSDLEDLGLIVSPHTSAGRIPTARGYRLFVDTMLTVQKGAVAAPYAGARSAAEGVCQGRQPAVEPVAVCRRGDCARRSSVFRHIEFLRLSERRLLVIIVSPNGDVQNRVIFTELDYSQSRADRGGEFPQFQLCRHGHRERARTPASRKWSRCARRSPR